MCIRKVVPSPKTPRSPWRRHLKEPMKPRLSRSVVSSARVNLNAHWAKFEELAVVPPLMAKSRSSLDNEINENLANELKEMAN